MRVDFPTPVTPITSSLSSGQSILSLETHSAMSLNASAAVRDILRDGVEAMLVCTWVAVQSRVVGPICTHSKE